MSGKTRIENLAIFSDKPAFAEKLHVGRPNIGDRDRFMARLEAVLDRNWLTNNGPMVQEFEQNVASILGVRHAIAMCNATVALEITTRALGLKGEVIVPSFTFIATAHALQWQGITPVFCDIDPQTHTLDIASVEQMITPRTSGIIGVHLWGRPCDTDALQDLADRSKLTLLFDAAHAFGCSHKGKLIGNFGAAEVFSFHATKFFNTFEGGAIVTNDDELAAKIRLMKNFGFSGYDEVSYIGTNGKMTEICAAMGLTGLEGIGDLIAVNRRNYLQYVRELENIPGVKPVLYSETDKCNYQYIVFEVDAEETGISRDELVAILHAENVVARRYFYPGCHKMEPYRSFFPHAGLLLPHTERLVQKVISLPNGAVVSSGDISVITEIIRFALRNGRDISQKLKQVS